MSIAETCTGPFLILPSVCRHRFTGGCTSFENAAT